MESFKHRAAVALACAALLAAAGAACAARPEAAEATRAKSEWSLGVAVDFQRPSPGDHLMDAMNALGWTDDTADTISNGLATPGIKFPYSSGVGYSSLRGWVDYSFAPKLDARAELSVFTTTEAHGHRGATGFEGYADVELMPYSFALLAFYGSRLKLGGGPTVDVTLVSAKVGHEEDHPKHVTAGATVEATFVCLRFHELDVVLRASQHFGATLDVGPYTDSFTGATYVVKDIPLTYTAIGIGLGWSPPGTRGTNRQE